jgi:hypothetical protein
VTSSSAIDNICIDNTRVNSYDVISISYGLSDHDAHCIVLKNISNLQKHIVQGSIMRIINKDSTAQFQNKLYNETWETVYQSNEINVSFNLFLNIYLRAYESYFLKQKVTNKCNNS